MADVTEDMVILVSSPVLSLRVFTGVVTELSNMADIICSIFYLNVLVSRVSLVSTPILALISELTGVDQFEPNLLYVT